MIDPKKRKLLELMRHQVGSVNLMDLASLDTLIGDARKQYLRDAESLWANPVFHNEINRVIRRQLEFIGTEAESDRQADVGRGTINGVTLLRERIEVIHAEYKGGDNPVKEVFDQFEVSL